jgi:rhodanese-related sulfurtransferase
MDTATPSLSPQSLVPGVGTPDAPLFIDVRKAEDFAASEHIIPGMLRWDFSADAVPPAELKNAKNVIAYCVKGAHIGITGAQKLTAMGLNATYIEGGLRDWMAGGAPVVKKRPDLGVNGETTSRWVTRARPKIDRIACPWLIRRFIDPRAEFFYVPTNEVFAFARVNNAAAYDIPGAALEHDGELCSFDNFLRAFEIKSAALDLLATIVRGADTDALHLAPQSAGLLAISLGLSRNFQDDHAMLEAAMPIYDALYGWAQTVVAKDVEKHNWKPA